MSYKIKFGAFLCACCMLLTACGASDGSSDVATPDVSVSESTTIGTDGAVDTELPTDQEADTTALPSQSEDVLPTETEQNVGSTTADTTTDAPSVNTSVQSSVTTDGKQTTKTSAVTNGSKTNSTAEKPSVTTEIKDRPSTSPSASSTTRKSKPSVVTVTGPTTTVTTTTAAPTDYPDKHPGGEWQLIWSDEFNGSSLDKSKWNVEIGGNGLIYKKESNVKVEKGKCVLTLLRDNSVSGYQYTGTSITTAHKFSFQYGRLEFRAKLPYGKGVWPALWTMGDYYLTTNDELGWPRCGEIDVMELVGAGGADGKDVYRENKKVTGNLHWGVNRAAHQGSYSYHFLSDGAAANNYHLYAVEWDEDAIVWYVDDIETHRVTLDDPTMLDSFHQKHWIIMNVALYESADAITPLPQSMYVDYVRVYQKK